ncbi:MAG TPA: DUF433 domain-containing protein [Thermoanaerobaculia bacterium]|nr:DUF433 domain-containing protein [Thermoanaerobaculia bacterium]
MHERIKIDPQIQHGRPVIRGTRVPVIRILGELAGGMTREKIAEEYGVTIEDVIAAIDYAAELVEQEQERPVPVQ